MVVAVGVVSSLVVVAIAVVDENEIEIEYDNYYTVVDFESTIVDCC